MTPRAEILRLADEFLDSAKYRGYSDDEQAVYTECATKLRALAQSEGGGGHACMWVLDPDDSSWDTACGNKHQFAHGDAADNLHVFCPYCGGNLVEPNYDAPPEAGA